MKDLTQMTPTAIGIGAQKSGTAWLAHAFLQHPSLWNPGTKEIHFFDKQSKGTISPKNVENFVNRARVRNRKKELKCDVSLIDDIAKHGLNFQSYKHLFANAPEDSKGWDITPSYSAMSEEKIDFMIQSLPKAKYIYIVRDAASRAKSSLRMKFEIEQRQTGRGKEVDLEAVAKSWLEDDKMFRGRYSKIIPTWDAKLEEQTDILYLPFRRMINDPYTLMKEIENFLGVENFDGYQNLESPQHITRKQQIPTFAANIIDAEMRPENDFILDRFGAEFRSLI